MLAAVEVALRRGGRPPRRRSRRAPPARAPPRRRPPPGARARRPRRRSSAARPRAEPAEPPRRHASRRRPRVADRRPAPRAAAGSAYAAPSASLRRPWKSARRAGKAAPGPVEEHALALRGRQPVEPPEALAGRGGRAPRGEHRQRELHPQPAGEAQVLASSSASTASASAGPPPGANVAQTASSSDRCRPLTGALREGPLADRPRAAEPLERRERLGGHLVHVEVLVAREPADERDAGRRPRRAPRSAGTARGLSGVGTG